MKDMIKLLVAGVTISVGIELGSWLWEEVIEDKVNNLKERITDK